MIDYYKILGVKEGSTKEEIKKAYRKLSLKHHPDKGGDSEKFAEINNAFSTLYDDEKRQQYEMKKKYGENAGIFGGGMRGGMNVNSGMPDELFKMFFGGGGVGGVSMDGNPFSHMSNNPNVRIFHNGVQINPNRLNKPVPIVMNIEITLEEAFNGLKYPLEVERWVKEDDTTKRTEKETIYIDIHRGVDNNETMIIRGKGNVIDDTQKGDIKIFIKIKNNTKYIRRGLDLIYKKDITLKDALCGFSFVLEYFNNKSFTITNNNTVIKENNNVKIVKNLGMERNGTKGNIIIEFSIKYPDNLTTEQKNKLREIL